MKERLTKGQLAKAKGVSVRTVDRWIEKGCPSELEEGQHRLDLDAVNAWLDAQEPEPGPAAQAAADADPAKPSVPRDPARQADVVRKVNLARRSELELAAERGLKDLGLDEQIRKARTFEEYAALDREVGALLANGTLTPDRARAIQGSISDARQNTKAHLESGQGQEIERFVLASEDALKIAEAFEGIVSDERRAALVAHVLAEAAADLAEHPNVDLADGVPEEPETQTGDEEPA